MRKAVVLLGLFAAGCATRAEPHWSRIDGGPIIPQQIAVDETVCRGEMQKANLSSTMEAGVVVGAQGLYSPRGRAVVQVYDGCMAQRGYMRQG